MLESFDAQSAKTPTGENPTPNEQGKKTKKKSSTSETGHAKNIGNFQNLISFCLGYGFTYNPSKESLTIAELQNVYQEAILRLNVVKTNKTSFDMATNARRHAFEDLKPYTTKVMNAFMVSGADKLVVDDLKSVNKKIQGARVKKIKEEEEGKEDSVKTISTSQQSYDRLIDHFANFIQVLEKSNTYTPNEIELEALQARMQNMKITNTTLIDAYTQYSNALIERNKILYDVITGLTQIAKEVKQYVKSVYGATSPQYKQISSLEFKTINW